jgi:F-type H+-transporting ATPase subunit epsilon
MAGTFKFELVSPEKVMFSGDASEVIVPGMNGQFTVLPGHAPFISTLRPGTLVIKLAGGDRQIYVRGGIAEVEPDSLTVLAQQLIDLEADGRQDAVEAEIKTAEALLAESASDDERLAARDTLDQLRAIVSR